MSSWSLSGKRALVTGGTKGIGRAIVDEFLALGAEVVFTARKPMEVAAVEQELRQQGHAVHGLVTDVSADEDRQRVRDWIAAHWGFLDILVNNAGINIRKRAADYSVPEYMQVIGIDLLAPFELCRGLLPLLQKGHKPSVINNASVAGSFDLLTGAPYGMSKAGLIQLSRHLAVEWAGYGIRVNTVSPWYTATPLTETTLGDPKREAAIIAKTPLRRVADSVEIAAAVAFLAMDKASYITGHNLSVDGGATSGLL
jgi:Tropinone reductase 1